MTDRQFGILLVSGFSIAMTVVVVAVKESNKTDEEAYRQRAAMEARACSLQLGAARTNADTQRTLFTHEDHWYGDTWSCAKWLAVDTTRRIP